MLSVKAVKTLNRRSTSSPRVSDRLSCQSTATLVRFNTRGWRWIVFSKVLPLRHFTASSAYDASCAFHPERMDHLRRVWRALKTLCNLSLSPQSDDAVAKGSQSGASTSLPFPTDTLPSVVETFFPSFTLHPSLHPSTF